MVIENISVVSSLTPNSIGIEKTNWALLFPNSKVTAPKKRKSDHNAVCACYFGTGDRDYEDYYNVSFKYTAISPGLM